jgi:tRNA pseudouridine13 synthase
VLRSLREKPDDHLRAFLQVDAAYRALHLFAYQSWLWNEGVRRLLQLSLPREALFPLRYQAGTLLFHREADPATLRWLRSLTFPLLAPDTQITDARVAEAVTWVLGKDKLRLEQLRVAGAPRLLFFKHEERPVLVQPSKLVLGRTEPDELNRGSFKLNVAFTLPPGSYATLVVKRLFHGSHHEDTAEEIRLSQRRSVRPDEVFDTASGDASEQVGSPRSALRSPAPPATPNTAPSGPRGFRAQARARKQARAEARARSKRGV